MPIAPPRRISKTRKRKRRTHFKIEVPGMMLCPNCGEMKLSHAVCKACGFYDGKQVLTIKEKAVEEDKEAEKTTKKAKKTEKSPVDVKPAKKSTHKVESVKPVEPKKTVRKATKKPQGAE